MTKRQENQFPLPSQVIKGQLNFDCSKAGHGAGEVAKIDKK